VAVFLVALPFLVFTPAPCSAAPDSLYQEARPAMGTTVEVYLYAPARAEAAQLFELAFEEIERVEDLLSTYRPTSEVSRINAAAGRGPVTTDPEVFGLIDRALEFSRRTQGAFDITVGPLVEAWGFFRGDGHRATDAELQAARATVGWWQVNLDHASRSVAFRKPGVELDFGAIGKGYALDRVARLLRDQGVRSALLGAGQSSYVAIGSPPGAEGWTIRVPDPHNHDQALSTVTLRNAALSTSGSDQRFFEREGRRYTHIIDPRTGEPVTGMRQVTVLAETATDADALSTGLFVLGAVEAAELIRGLSGAGALLVADEVVSVAWPAEVSITETKP
jgi:thiamine biosynthesis lipoprotein